MSYAPKRRAYEIAAPSGTSTALLRAFRVVLDTIEYGVLFVDEDLRVRMHNRAFREIWKVPGDFLSKKPALRELMEYVREHGHVYNVADDDWDGYVQARLDAIRSGDTTPMESQRTDGTVIQHQCSALPDGGYILTYFDITAGKLAEQALRDSEQRLVDALESTSDGFALFDKDDRLALCNSRYRELYPQLADVLVLGTPFETIVRAVAERNLVRDPQGRVEEWFQKRMAQHRNPTGPQLQPQADGRWLQIDERKTDEGGTVIVFTDITEIKRHEQELAEANRMQGVVLNELHAVLDAADYGILFLDADLNVRLHNRAYREVWEMPETLFADNPTFHDLLNYSRQTGLFGVPDEHWEEFANSRIEAVQKGEFPQPELTLANGKVLQFQCIKLPDGGRMLTYFDITERKRAEEALRESEERFRNLIEGSIQGILIDQQRKPVFVNQSFADMLGYESPEEILTMDSMDPCVAPHERARLRAYSEVRLKEDGIAPMHYEYDALRKDGSIVTFQNVARRISWEGQPATQSTVIDVTERRRVEQALRDSEERYALAMEAINEGVYDWNIATDKIYYSPRVQAAFALSPNELRTREDWFNRVHPDDRQTYKDAFVAHFKGETERFVCEYRIHAGDGTLRWARQHGLVLRDEHGRAYRMIGSTGDITALRQSEQELQEKTTILETTLESMDQGISMVDANLRVIAFNRKTLELLDLPPERFKLGYHIEEEYRYNAERGEYGEGDIEEQVCERLERAKRFEPYHEERFRPNGRVLDVWRSRLPGGGFVTTYKDITERKRSEQALQEQTDFIRLNQVITAAANEATSVEDALKVAIDEICAHTRWPVGHVYMFDGDNGELVPTGLWHLDDPQRFEAFRSVTDVTRFASGIGLPGRVLASGKPEWIEDVTKDPNFPRAKLADGIGVKGAFAIPVLVGREVAAVLEVFSDQPAAPNQSLLDVVGQIGTQLGRV
ncbi:MAG: PAS-domain containing protein, partial [Acidiferrobacterales bacterium]